MTDAVVTVGLVLLAAALVGGGLKLLGAELPVISSVPRQVVAGLVGGALLIMGLYEPGDQPPDGNVSTIEGIVTTGRIVTPRDRPVMQHETASGVVANLPQGHKIFLLVEIGRYYPQSRAVPVLPDGTLPVRFGQSQEPGAVFMLHLVEVGPDGVMALTAYFERAEESGEFPGFPRGNAPSDMQFLDSVRLVRG